MIEFAAAFTQPSAIPVQQAWEMLTEQLRLQMDRAIFNLYLRDTRVLDLSAGVLTLQAPSADARDWIAARLNSLIRRHIAPLVGFEVQLNVVLEDQALKSQPEAPASPAVMAGAANPAQAAAEAQAQPSQKNGTFRVAEEKTPKKPVKTARKPGAKPQKPAESLGVMEDAAPSEQPPAETDQPEAAQQGMGPVAGLIEDACQNREITSPAEADRLAPSQSEVEPLSPDALTSGSGEAESVSPTSEDGCAALVIEEIADSVETALTQPGRIVSFPRYELRHIPLVGPEAFFLRLAFLQERFLHTTPEGRAQPFETHVEALLRWSNVGRATLHRFKKGDPARGQQPAAGWFGIEQLPSAPRSAGSQQQPPCRYRLQQGIPLTPMDADRLAALLAEAGFQVDPLGALQALCSRPQNELLEYPPPAPNPEQKRRAPAFITVAGVVQSALGSRKLPADLRAQVQEATNQLSEHLTTPGQVVFVSWYFLRHWLPLLGHDAAALVLYTRAQGYYNPQDQELRDEISVPGGYSQLARVIGLRRDRTIGDWLPNIFERETGSSPTGDSDKWQREQQRQQTLQALIGEFLEVVPGSRKKTPAGHYAFNLRVQIQAEPLTPADLALRDWVYQTLAACLEANVLDHFYAWVTSPVIEQLAGGTDGEIDGSHPIDGGGTLGASPDAGSLISISQNDGGHPSDGEGQIDGWGILTARACLSKMTAGEFWPLADDGWGILGDILADGAGILAHFEMTAGELFKGLLRLNTFWETIRLKTTSTRAAAGRFVKAGNESEPDQQEVVVETGEGGNAEGFSEAREPAWDLRAICRRNGGMNSFREQIVASETSVQPFLSWLLYAYSFKGQGIKDPVGWSLTRLRESPGCPAEGVFAHLAALPPGDLSHLLRAHLDSGAPPHEENWRFAFRDVPITRLRELGHTLGLAG